MSAHRETRDDVGPASWNGADHSASRSARRHDHAAVRTRSLHSMGIAA